MDAPTMVQPRQLAATEVPDGFVNEDGHWVPFWYSRTGVIIKWSVFLGLLVILTTYVMVGYLHAKRRIRKGLPPLAYHRWLISRAELARVDPRYAFPQSNYRTYRPEYANQQYNMQGNMPPPPPMYDPSGRPPMYDGPAGGTKTAPSQWTQDPTHRPSGAAAAGAAGAGGQDEEYGAPSGPPPAHMQQPEHTGSTNPYRQ